MLDSPKYLDYVCRDNSKYEQQKPNTMPTSSKWNNETTIYKQRATGTDIDKIIEVAFCKATKKYFYILDRKDDLLRIADHQDQRITFVRVWVYASGYKIVKKGVRNGQRLG